MDLQNTQVTDTGLRELRGMTSLQFLGLSGTKVTVAGILQLRDLPILRTINIERILVSSAELNELKAAFPGCFFVR